MTTIPGRWAEFRKNIAERLQAVEPALELVQVADLAVEDLVDGVLTPAQSTAFQAAVDAWTHWSIYEQSEDLAFLERVLSKDVGEQLGMIGTISRSCIKENMETYERSQWAGNPSECTNVPLYLSSVAKNSKDSAPWMRFSLFLGHAFLKIQWKDKQLVLDVLDWEPPCTGADFSTFADEEAGQEWVQEALKTFKSSSTLRLKCDFKDIAEATAGDSGELVELTLEFANTPTVERFVNVQSSEAADKGQDAEDPGLQGLECARMLRLHLPPGSLDAQSGKLTDQNVLQRLRKAIAKSKSSSADSSPQSVLKTGSCLDEDDNEECDEDGSDGGWETASDEDECEDEEEDPEDVEDVAKDNAGVVGQAPKVEDSEERVEDVDQTNLSNNPEVGDSEGDSSGAEDEDEDADEDADEEDSQGEEESDEEVAGEGETLQAKPSSECENHKAPCAEIGCSPAWEVATSPQEQELRAILEGSARKAFATGDRETGAELMGILKQVMEATK
eukprot:gene3553-4478_t